jgi:hypothetical protein
MIDAKTRDERTTETRGAASGGGASQVACRGAAALVHRLPHLVLAVVAVAGWPAAAWGQVEEGWQVIHLTEGTGYTDVNPRINDRGDIVFKRWWNPQQGQNDDAIMLYKREGVFVTVTDDDATSDVNPLITDDRTVYWTRRSDSSFDFMRWREGEGEQLMWEGPRSEAPILHDVNESSELVLRRRAGDHYQVYRFAEGEMNQISQNALDNHAPRINESGQIVWTRYNFNVNPWRSHVLLWDGTETRVLSGDNLQAQSPHINDKGHAVWASSQMGVELWVDGVTQTIAEDGLTPAIDRNDRVAFGWYGIWLWDNGVLRLIFEAPEAYSPSVNYRGELVFAAGVNFLDYDLYLYTKDAFVSDLDFDGDVDLRDYSVIQSCVTNEPTGDCALADFDRDVDVDVDDFRLWAVHLAGPE